MYVLDLRLIQASLNQFGLAAVSFRPFIPEDHPCTHSSIKYPKWRHEWGQRPIGSTGHMFSFNEKQHLHYTRHSNDPARVASSK